MNPLKKSTVKISVWIFYLLFTFTALIHQPLFAVGSKCPTGATISSTADQTLCLGSTATTLLTKITSTGSSATKVRYTWWYNTTNSTDTTTAIKVRTITKNLGTSINDSYKPISSVLGTRYYFCVVTNNACSTIHITATVKVMVHAPIIAVSPTSGTICNPGGTAVTLNANGASTYVWSANGASTSWGLSSTTGTSVTALPLSTKTYKITGTDANGCSNTASVIVTVNTTSFTISASPTSICPGSSSVLKANKKTYSYIWNPGAIVGDSISVSPTVTTSYTVTATTALGCILTKQVVVAVRPLPIVTVSPSSSTFCGSATSTLLTGTVSNVAPTTGARMYSWSIGATTANITVMPTSTTVYTLTGTDGKGCTKTATATIVVNPIPVVTANASSSSVCTNNDVTLTGGGATSYSWTGGATNGVSFIPTSTQTYTVTGTTNGCTGSSQVTVVVTPCIPPIASYIGGPKEVCGTTTATYNTPLIPGATSYTWSVNSGLSIQSGQGTNSIVVSIPVGFDKGDVSVYASNTSGDGPIRYITVYNIPISVITSGPTFVCGLSQATYTCSGPTTALNYFWTIPAGTTIISGQGTNTLTISFDNTFSSGNLYIQNQTGCGLGASRSIKINSSPATAPRYISGPRDLCNMTTATFTADVVANATSYSWILPAGLTLGGDPSANSVLINIDNTFVSGNIGVSALSPCGSSAAVYLNERRVNCTPPVPSPERSFKNGDNLPLNNIEKSVNIFPNPTDGKNVQLIFEGFDGSESIVIQLYDITGKIILNTTSSLEKIKADYLFNIGSLTDGIYLVKISQGDNYWNNKLIIKK